MWRVDAATGRSTKLIAKPKTIFATSDATPDGALLGVSTNDGTGQMHAGLYTVAGARFRWPKPTIWKQSATAISPVGRLLAVETGIDGRTEIELVDIATLGERVLPLPPGSNSVAGPKPFTPEGRRLLVLQSDATVPGTPVMVDVESGKVDAPIQLAMAGLDPAMLPTSAMVTYMSFDGTLVSAILRIPFNAKRDGP